MWGGGVEPGECAIFRMFELYLALLWDTLTIVSDVAAKVYVLFV